MLPFQLVDGQRLKQQKSSLKILGMTVLLARTSHLILASAKPAAFLTQLRVSQGWVQMHLISSQLIVTFWAFFWELIPKTPGLWSAWLKLLIDKQQEDGESQEWKNTPVHSHWYVTGSKWFGFGGQQLDPKILLTGSSGFCWPMIKQGRSSCLLAQLLGTQQGKLLFTQDKIIKLQLSPRNR